MGICFFLYAEEAKGQCIANFGTTGLDRQPLTAGCIPNMIIQFIDSSGCNYTTSPYYSHTWKFGDVNNTISHSREPVFGYFQPGTFCITLIVTPDGNNYDSTTRCVTVFDPPVPDMVPSVTSGCNPLNVCFTDASTSPNGTVVSWLWDFCDGTVSRQQNPCHTLTLLPQQNCFCVSLQVTNDKGCTAAKTFPNVICIDRPPVADFTVNNTLLCGRPFTVTFTNRSTSVNNLAYKWYFGDGDSSTLRNPVHTYDSVACYTVSLIITDTECGYSDTLTKTNYICTSDIDANFVPSQTVVCQSASVQFYDASHGNGINSWSWNFGNGGPSNAQNPSHVYQNNGTYTVTLTVRDAIGCSSTETKTNLITVKPKPTVDFNANNTSSCKAPFVVTFTATNSPGVVSWQWSFGDSLTGTGQTVTHTYSRPGNFNVTLEVTDTGGCTNSITKQSFITIQPRTVAFSADVYKGCAPLTVHFTDESFPPFQVWSWNFGDSLNPPNTSSLQNPTHTFPDTGKFVVRFFASDAAFFCSGEITDTIYVGEPLQPNFEIDSNPACVNEEVVFTNTTDTTGITDINKIQWFWNFGGATSGLKDPPSQYYDEPTPPNDSLEVYLVAGYNGCFDTTRKKLVILYPKAEFTIVTSCTDPGTVIITDSSQGANRWFWEFGDGRTLSMPLQRPHQDTLHYSYAVSGNYQIRLEVENTVTGCKTEQIQSVEVSVTRAAFDADKYRICEGEPVCFQNQSIGTLAGYTWLFGDGLTSNAPSPCNNYLAADTYSVTLMVTDINGCSDTLVKPNLIIVSGVMADFYCLDCFGCIPPTGTGNTITFRDSSRASPGSNIVSYKWDVESGFTINNSTPQPVTHTYNNAGLYAVTLTVSNNFGCTDVETKNNYVDIRMPEACFNLPFGIYCEEQPVTFPNCSRGRGLSSTWDYGDAVVNTAGVHAYADTGCYDVTLYVVDGNGCRDTLRVDSAICIRTPDLWIGADDTSSVCPPHLACFDYTADFYNIPIKRPGGIHWDFGDRSTSQLDTPCHLYTRAGLFTVTLKVVFENFCVDSFTRTQYISVGGAVGNITADPDTGCVPMDVCLDANSIGAVSHFWIWGDGDPGVLRGLEDTACHIYRTPSIYVPAVVLTDTQSPPCSYVLYADFNLLADTVFADFGTLSDTVCRDDAVQFHDSSRSLIDSSMVRWVWDFGDSTPSPPDTTRHPVHVFRSVGPDTVCLTAYSSFGCSAKVCKQIFVRDKPNAFFTVSDTTGCDSLRVNFFDASTPGNSAPINKWYWDFGDPDTNADDTAAIQGPVNYLYRDTGRYSPYLVVTDEAGCDDTATVNIGVYRTPLGILNGDTLQICRFDTVQLRSDTGYVSYQWTPDTALSDATISSPLAFPRDTTTYAVLITEAHGCDKLDTITINVIPLPPLTVRPYPNTTICYGDTIQLTATGGANHRWEPPWGIVTSTNIPNPLASPIGTVTYKVTNEGIGGCKNTDTVRVIVSKLDAIFFGERSCFGDPTDFFDYSTYTDLPITSWQWDFGYNNAASSQQNPSYTYGLADTFIAQLVISDAIGCTDTARQAVIIDTPAIAVAGFDATICLGDSVRLFSSGGDTAFWTPQDASIDSPGIFNPLVRPTSTTTYTAHVTNGVCPYEEVDVTITVIPPPDIQTIDDTTILRGTDVELATTIDRYDSILWNPPDSLSCVNCLSPVASPDESTTYTIFVQDQYGCTNSADVTIGVKVECGEDQIWVASAFTPNGDNINDEVYVRLIGLEKLNYFRIYDRWGKLMFETDNPGLGWPGTNEDGVKLNTGVYVYVCEAVCWYKKTIVKTGNITLIK